MPTWCRPCKPMGERYLCIGFLSTQEAVSTEVTWPPSCASTTNSSSHPFTGRGGSTPQSRWRWISPAWHQPRRSHIVVRNKKFGNEHDVCSSKRTRGARGPFAHYAPGGPHG